MAGLEYVSRSGAEERVRELFHERWCWSAEEVSDELGVTHHQAEQMLESAEDENVLVSEKVESQRYWYRD
jgi:predicted ArsR family transcriptional regulator